MQIIEDFTPAPAPTSIALGMFDGLHLGHRAVIRCSFTFSEALIPSVFSFTIDQEAPGSKPNFSRILSPSRQTALLEKMGCQLLFRPPFSQICQMEPEAFFSELLINRYHAKALFCGEDFRFGYRARGNTDLLRQWSKENGIHFETIPPVKQNGITVSSTEIRKCLTEGRMEDANRLLSSPYAIDLPVIHGRELGRTISFPTINQMYKPGDLLPKFGVYATVATIDQKRYPGLTNVGVKPTVGKDNPPSAETNIIGFSGDVYGKTVLLEFIHFIREEKKFASIDALKQQIAEDKDAVIRFFSRQGKKYL